MSDSKIKEVYDQKLKDIFENVLNMSFSPMTGGGAAFAEGTNDHLIKTTVAISYMIDGQWYTKGISDNIAAATYVCAVQAAGTRCRYLLTIDSAGTVYGTKGTQVRSLTTAALATISVDAMTKKFIDSGNHFGGFMVGDLVRVSGMLNNENNGIFKVHAVDTPTGAWLQIEENCLVDEAVAAGTMTMVVESALPDRPARRAVIGTITITTVAGTFTLGVDDITDDAAGATITFHNFGMMPSGSMGIG